MNLSDCQRLLIVKPSSLGDIVHTLPAVAAIHRSAPGLEIDWIVNSEWAPLLEGLPLLRRVIAFPRREMRGIRGVLRARSWAASELGGRPYDLSVDFQGLFRSAWLARAAARHTVGFRQSREGAPFLYHRRVPVEGWSRRHAVDRNLALAAALGATVGEPEFPLPDGVAPSDLPPFGAAPVLLHPFSRGLGKSLAIDETRELCRLLAPLPVVLVGVPGEPLEVNWPDGTVDLLGRTSLAELIHLIRLSAFVVSVDSGPMHLAAGLTDRVLSLHTWSNPAMVGPCRPGAWVWRDSQLVRVGGLEPDRFPERRDLAADFARRPRLLEAGSLERIARFVHEQVGNSPQ